MKGHKSVLLSPALLAFAAMFMILLSCTCPSGGIVVPTATPVPPPTEPGGEGPVTVSLTFTADRTSIQPGECATLTWDVEGSGQFWVELNGESVSPNSYRQVCPPQTTTYRLIAGTGAALRQELKRGEITIVVSGGGPGPTPTTKPAPTPTTKPAPTPTTKPAPPSVTINFWADSTNLTAGNCTTLHWDVEHATAVYLNGAGVAGHATQQVCPPSTATYTLHVEYAGGATDRQITINVTAPARSFTFSPKSGPAGSEVHLYLSVPANQLVVYFAGRMLPKQMSPDRKTVTVTIPGDASGSGYFELQWDGQNVKASEPFVVTPPAAQGDLILEDVFLSTQGEIILRVAQSPTGKLSGTFQYRVEAVATGVIMVQGSFQIPTGSQAFWTGYKQPSPGGTGGQYRIRIDPNNLIPETNENNNELIRTL